MRSALRGVALSTLVFVSAAAVAQSPAVRPDLLKQRFAVRQAVSEAFSLDVAVTIVADSVRSEWRLYLSCWRRPVAELFTYDSWNRPRLQDSVIAAYRQSSRELAWAVSQQRVPMTLAQLRLVFLYPLGRGDRLVTYEVVFPSAALNDSLATEEMIAAAESVLVDGYRVQPEFFHGESFWPLERERPD